MDESPDSAAGIRYGLGKFDQRDSQSLEGQFASLDDELPPITYGLHFGEGWLSLHLI
jgi:hypothetical protein